MRRLIHACENSARLVIGFRLLHSRTREELAAWLERQFGRVLPFGATSSFANWGVLDTTRPLPGNAKWISINYNKTQCAVPLLAMQVSSNGDVSFCPCDDFQNVEELKLGNVRDTTLAQMYDSDKVTALYDFGTNVPKWCRACSFHVPLADEQQVETLCKDPMVSIGA